MMKKLAALYCVISIFCAYATQQNLITVVIMVRNEEAVIAKTLEPYVKAGINSFLIFDTGSIDNTISNAEFFFKTHAIEEYAIVEEAWIDDFAASRNHALDAADERFPETSFFLMPDAEWYMHNVEGLIDFCLTHRDEDTPCYLVRIMNENTDFPTPRLIRASSKARFEGKIHESMFTLAKVPNDIYFKLGASRQGIEKSRKRWERDLKILLKEHEENPDHTRTTFYLAQTYDCLGDAENAYRFYKIRSEQQGYREENYEALYRLGKTTEILASTDSNYTWHMAFDYYCKAHELLPHRAEPLVRIADHYWPDGQGPLNIPLCYIFAKRACELEYPEHDLLFIDPEMYSFKRYELLSKAAWHVGDFENGEVATRNAIKKREMPNLFYNLSLYIARRMQAR